MTNPNKNNQIIIYNTADGEIKIEARMKDETVWLSQKQMAELFDKNRKTITEHIQNVFKEGELDENSVCRKFQHTAEDGKIYDVNFYNLDVIISVGYRVKSLRGTQFRIWATQKLKEYIIKGFVLDDERLKGNGGGNYWKELLDRIRDIRSSEKALYRQVLDLYATSIDYKPQSLESITFFKTVQNKLHYATNKRTAAETIAERVDAEKDFMGLTTFVGVSPTLSEATIAKNYLTEEELFRLNRMVSAFFDLAEIKAKEKQTMRMADWVAELDKFVKNYGKGVLQNAGEVSHQQAAEKAIKEYKKFQAKTLSPVEKAYLESIRMLEKRAEKKIKNNKSKK